MSLNKFYEQVLFFARILPNPGGFRAWECLEKRAERRLPLRREHG
jgi:hypothetical protein